ncbi:MAG TPA: hypothetical protein VK152_09620 [Paludibacter sp.]|nr:hypothetical protein [Paludibacter sp.]
MKKLNAFLFKKRAGKYLAANYRERKFVNYENAKTVLILFESDYSEKNVAIRRIIQTLQQDGKKVSAWGYAGKKDVATAVLPDFRILHRKDVDFSEKPVKSYIADLEGSEFDLLVDLSARALIPLQYMALYARAACKAGISKTELPVYDFVLDVGNVEVNPESPESPTEELYLFNQIIFYLKSIQTND